MATGKTTALTFRIEPELIEALRAAVEREHRSIANMVAVLIMDCASATVSQLNTEQRMRKAAAATTTRAGLVSGTGAAWE